MSIVTVQVTPTHRYFARKRKDDIIRWLEDLRRWAGEETPEFSIEQFNAKRKLTCDALASEAMALYRRLPTQ